jgi:hypothetical protein
MEVPGPGHAQFVDLRDDVLAVPHHRHRARGPDRRHPLQVAVDRVGRPVAVRLNHRAGPLLVVPQPCLSVRRRNDLGRLVARGVVALLPYVCTTLALVFDLSILLAAVIRTP